MPAGTSVPVSVDGAPGDLPLFELAAGVDCRARAAVLSCHQEIASDGAFSLGMLAEFDTSIEKYGPWFYPRLFWECGAIGQVRMSATAFLRLCCVWFRIEFALAKTLPIFQTFVFVLVSKWCEVTELPLST